MKEPRLIFSLLTKGEEDIPHTKNRPKKGNINQKDKTDSHKESLVKEKKGNPNQEDKTDFHRSSKCSTNEKPLTIEIEAKEKEDAEIDTIEVEAKEIKAVSYTHLTLPTKRIV